MIKDSIGDTSAGNDDPTSQDLARSQVITCDYRTEQSHNEAARQANVDNPTWV